MTFTSQDSNKLDLDVLRAFAVIEWKPGRDPEISSYHGIGTTSNSSLLDVLRDVYH